MWKPNRLLCLLMLFGLLAACERPDPEAVVVTTRMPLLAAPPTPLLVTRPADAPLLPTPLLRETAVPDLPGYAGTPTPDPPHALFSAEGAAFATHYVNAGETLGYIAQLYGSSVEELQGINQLADGNLLQVGQALLVPTQGEQLGPDLKLIPDSELVYGPAAAEFDVLAVAQRFGGYLLTYVEEVEGQPLGGPAVVSLVAHRFSVNPRLLLALLEYRSGWLTQAAVAEKSYPLGYAEPRAEGLYAQLSWAANQLNWGFYGRAEAGITSFLVGETTRLAYAPTINHGTAGVQTMLGAHPAATMAQWLVDVGPNGVLATYQRLFGSPFAFTVDPLWPEGLAQPALQLPWSSAETWYFTGGPHGGWAGGSAWAALDFAPPSEQFGCIQSDYWVTSMGDGLVTRSEFGAVVVDMDGDGYAGTGWAILYMHVETRDRVPVGTWLQTGDRIGHPSCEGGFSGGTHLHVARLYNGRWVSADGALPFVMGGWMSQGLGREYDGMLVRGGVTKEARDGGRDEINAIPGQ